MKAKKSVKAMSKKAMKKTAGGKGGSTIHGPILRKHEKADI